MSELPKLSGRVCVYLILLVGVLAHGLCLGADYFMDDGVVMDPRYLAWDGDWSDSLFRIIPAFIAMVTFQVAGDSSMAQHVWNLGIHLTLAVVVFWGGLVFLEESGIFKGEALVRRAAFFGALVFACHPMCTEAVNYARCTRIQMVALFSVLAAIGTLRFCQRPSWRAGLGTLAVVVLATFSKHPGMFHAVGNVMVVVAVFAKRDGLTRWLRRPVDWAVACLGVAAFFWMGMHGFTSWLLSGIVNSLSGGNLDFFEHALTQGRVFWGYARRIVLPVGLSADHYIPMTRSFSDVPAVLMTLGVLAAAGGAVWMMFVRRLRVFGVLFMLALAPLLLRFLYPISEFMVEYRVYPAMPWVAVLAGAGLGLLYQKDERVMKFVVLFLVVAGVFGSALRSAVWQDAEAVAWNVLEQYPNNNRARNELQRLAKARGDHQAVLDLRGDVVEAMVAVGRYNQANVESGRAYLVLWAEQWYLMAESRVALSLAEAVGSEQALAYISAVVKQTSLRHPEFFDANHENFRYGEPLVELREQIEKFGDVQDRRRLKQASARGVDAP